MGAYELWVRFMCEYELWVKTNYGGGTDTRTHKQTERHINTMTQPGLGAGRSENQETPRNPAISSHVWPFQPFPAIPAIPAISSHFRQFPVILAISVIPAISSHFSHSSHFKPFQAIFGYFQLFQPFPAIFSYFQPCSAIFSNFSHFQPFSAIPAFCGI